MRRPLRGELAGRPGDPQASPGDRIYPHALFYYKRARMRDPDSRDRPRGAEVGPDRRAQESDADHRHHAPDDHVLHVRLVRLV